MVSKVLWEHHSIKKFFDTKKKFSYRFGVKKASKSKFASVRLKTYLNEKIQTKQFLCANNLMGILRFEVHLKLKNLDFEVASNLLKIGQQVA